MVGREGIEPTTTASSRLEMGGAAQKESAELALKDFERFLRIDQLRKPETVHGRVNYLRAFFKRVGKGPNNITRDDIRDALDGISVHKRDHILKALRLFYGKFLGQSALLDGIRFGNPEIRPLTAPRKDQIRQFYETIDDPEERTIFLLAASSGLRRHEIVELRLKDLDFEKRMIIPDYESATKRMWVTFYNSEADADLKDWLKNRNKRSDRLFPMARAKESRLFRAAMDKTGLHITLKTLRVWFCCEMARMGVQDRYVDAFCGRVPKSILSRHYTDYSPDRLREIYDRAGLRVLT